MDKSWWVEERGGQTACQVEKKTPDDAAQQNSFFPKVAFEVAQFWVSRAEYNKSRLAWEIRHISFWDYKLGF